MGVIKLLDRELINMIAAGEVVERPASVVKELVENSIDAGATHITVEIRNGGKTFIRVSDDGKGMTEEDARTAFIRHATSKISSKNDLFAIHTMGFRGEALAAIASVSKLEINTITKDDEFGTRLFFDAGRELYCEQVGLPQGTTIFVKDLFYNIPVRMNFLKKDSTESANIVSLVDKLAIGNPEISFKLIVDGKTTLTTEKDSSFFDAVYNVYGNEIAESLLEVNHSEQEISVTGFVSQPRCNRSNRNFQLFYVNGRVVKNKTVTAAVDRAYHNSLMNGRHPVVVLKINLPPRRVDVNVHPTKTEIKFSDDQKIFDVVYYAVKKALDKEKNSAFSPENIEKIKNDFQEQSEMLTTFSASELFDDTTKNSKMSPEVETNLKAVYSQSYVDIFKMLIDDPVDEKSNVDDVNIALETSRNVKLSSDELSKVYSNIEEKNELSLFDDEISFKFIGELFKTYIIVECGSYFYLIDKHAAHEKLIFDKVYEKFIEGDRYCQHLITPLRVSLTPEEMVIANDNVDQIGRFGFVFDVFGDKEVIIRTAPYVMSIGDAVPTFVELIDLLSESKNNVEITDFENKAIKMIACKAAIKAGYETSDFEMQEFIKSIIKAGNVNYCPHGRPIICEFSKKGIEKAFKRIV